MRWKPSIRNGPTGTNLPMTGGIRGIFEQKYQSADDVYSQFGYFGRGKDALMGEAHFLRAYTYLVWRSVMGGIHHYEVSGV